MRNYYVTIGKNKSYGISYKKASANKKIRQLRKRGIKGLKIVKVWGDKYSANKVIENHRYVYFLYDVSRS